MIGIEEKNGLIPCYGMYSRRKPECRKCGVRRYCTEARTPEGAGKYRERTRIEVAAALEGFATLPAVCETPSGRSLRSWNALSKILVFLTSLHPTTLEILKLKLRNPQWRSAEIARAVGIRPRSAEKEIAARPPLAGMFHPVEERKSFTMPAGSISRASHVYLAGPMTGLPECNFPAFSEAEELVAARFHCNVINPAYLSYLIGEGRTHAHYLEVALAIVRTSDFLVMLPGWENSAGARTERATAEALGIPAAELAEVLK